MRLVFCQILPSIIARYGVSIANIKMDGGNRDL